MAADNKKLSVPRTVVVLGLVSLFMDVSSEMIHAVLPLFMAQSLGAGALLIGFTEGAAEGIALISKVFSGAIADRFGHRKLLVFLGYALGVASKPFFALADHMYVVMLARFSDRIGKGLRGAPRDAIVADVTPRAIQGAAFGLRQSLDAAGAFIGPALASLFLFVWAMDFRTIFWLALIPGAICLCLVIFGVEDKAVENHASAKERPKITLHDIWRHLTVPEAGAFRHVVLLGIVFSLARFSNAFIVLRAADVGMAVAAVPLVMVGMNLVFSASSYPFGKLADHFAPEHLLGLGLAFLIASDLVFAFWGADAGILLGVVLWGLHLGATQGVFSMMVAQTAEKQVRATAYGVFNFCSGIAMLASGVVAGVLWDFFGSTASFVGGAVFAFCSVAILLVWGMKKKERGLI